MISDALFLIIYLGECFDMAMMAWIVLISVVTLLVAHIILLFVNKKYRKETTDICGIVVSLFLLPVLVYTIGTCLFIVVRGDCFVAYYNPGGKEMFYYNGYEYYLVDDEVKELAMRSNWKDTDAYISDDPIAFPYFEYWWPNFFADELILSANEEPVYIKVPQWDGSRYYVREDVREQVQ